MAGYLLYFPGPPAPYAERFAEYGVADLAGDDEPAWLPIARGPDRGPGMLAAWPGPSGARPSAADLIASHKWHLARPARLNRKCWYGLPPRTLPQHLARRQQLASYPVKLADGQIWFVPSALQLPRRWGIGDGGQVSGQVEPQFIPFVERARVQAMLFMRVHGRPELVERAYGKFDLPESVPVSEMFYLAVAALALNYRVNANIVSRLGLLTDDPLHTVMTAAFDLPRVMDEQAKEDDTLAVAVGADLVADLAAAPGGSNL